MQPGTYDFEVIRGNTLPITLRLRDFDATGSAFVFRCVWDGGLQSLRKTTDDDQITVAVAPDPGEGATSLSVLELALAPLETRALGVGRVNRYEIERRIDGVETTFLHGYITAEDGVNDDA